MWRSQKLRNHSVCVLSCLWPTCECGTHTQTYTIMVIESILPRVALALHKWRSRLFPNVSVTSLNGECPLPVIVILIFIFIYSSGSKLCTYIIMYVSMEKHLSIIICIHYNTLSHYLSDTDTHSEPFNPFFSPLAIVASGGTLQLWPSEDSNWLTT